MYSMGIDLMKFKTAENTEQLDSKIISNYTNLKVYQVGFISAMRIFILTKNWPKDEKYALSSQIRRSSRSVCGNIAEAWRKRRYPAHFVSKLSDADAESAETEVWLEFAHCCKYIEVEEYKFLRNNYDYVCRMLYRMMKCPDDWRLRK
jgi:four helix bundle protein